MKLLLILFALLIQACLGTDRQRNPEAIYAFVETHINQREHDIRRYDPPPPPELRDSVGHNGRMKPDSVLYRLKPLRIYINPIVNYDSIIPGGAGIALGDLPFVEESQNFQLRLDPNRFLKKEGVLLLSTEQDVFFSMDKGLLVDEGYGGFVSFQNLYCSRDGQKAYFEFSIFKGSLNAATYAVNGEKQKDGTWEFKSQLLSIS